MLGNPKTHIRNIVSNMAMSLTTNTKNVIARTIESTVNKVMPKVYENQNRTKTFKKTSKEVEEYRAKYNEILKKNQELLLKTEQALKAEEPIPVVEKEEKPKAKVTATRKPRKKKGENE